MSLYDDFVATWTNKPCEVEDPTAVDQCMDLAFAWCDALGIDRATIRHQFAYQVWEQPTDLTVKEFELVPNTPNGVPPEGSLVIFKTTVGAAGHISIGSGKGNRDNFVSFDQNWSGASYCKMVTHSYTSVYGWLVRRIPVNVDPVIFEQSDAFIAVSTLLKTAANKDLVLAEINKLITIEDQAPAKDKTITDLNQQIAALDTKLQDLQLDHDTLTNEIATQAKMIQDQDLKIKGLQGQLQELKDTSQQPDRTGWQLIIDGIVKLIGGKK